MAKRLLTQRVSYSLISLYTEEFTFTMYNPAGRSEIFILPFVVKVVLTNWPLPMLNTCTVAEERMPGKVTVEDAGLGYNVDAVSLPFIFSMLAG